jgi:hypothetical protein
MNIDMDLNRSRSMASPSSLTRPLVRSGGLNASVFIRGFLYLVY